MWWTLCSVSCHFLVEFVVILRFKCQVVFWLIFLAYVCLIVGFRSQVLKFMCLHCLYTSCDNWSHCNNWFGSTCLHRGNSWSVSFLQVLLCFHTHHVWSILQINWDFATIFGVSCCCSTSGNQALVCRGTYLFPLFSCSASVNQALVCRGAYLFSLFSCLV